MTTIQPGEIFEMSQGRMRLVYLGDGLARVEGWFPDRGKSGEWATYAGREQMALTAQQITELERRRG